MKAEKPSLEALVESGEIEIEVLHPGGLEITKELAELCGVDKGKHVLDVASGTGESACFLAQTFGCLVTGVDASEYMVEKAREKARRRGLNIDFRVADAHCLPFEDNSFDIVISECTICLLDKDRAIREMVRVAKPGGYVGIHDVCWRQGTPESLKLKLAELEGERPETLRGWRELFEKAGLEEVVTLDRSYLLSEWVKDIKKKIGLLGQLKIFLKVVKKYGLSGLRNIRESEKIFESEYLGYGIIVGRKPGLQEV